MFRVNDVVQSIRFGRHRTVASVDYKEKTIRYFGGGFDDWATQRLIERPVREFSVGDYVIVLETGTIGIVRAKSGPQYNVGGVIYYESSLAPHAAPPIAEKRFLLLNDNSIIGRCETFEMAESSAKINNATEIVEVARRWELVTTFQEIKNV